MNRALIFTTLLCFYATSVGADEALSDPIPQKIAKGDIIVAVQDFVRVPRTEDSSSGNATNKAYARIQYIQPFGATVGPLLINDTRGVLYLTDETGREPSVFLDLREQDIGFYDAVFPNEMGVASIAFHPEFTILGAPGFGRFYTAYSAHADSGTANYHDDDAASHESVIREWIMYNPRGRVFQGTSREVFRIGEFAPNHNIGTIAFNPVSEKGSADYGMLYAVIGDGGAANDPRDYSQSLASPHGSIIRIDPMGGTDGAAYGIPPDNPFVNRPEAAPEIWAWGLRHSQHISWDSSGRMFINDIGQNQVEEVNLGRAGANYGWRQREGTFATAFARNDGTPGLVYAEPPKADEFVDPVAQYDHDEGHAIGGGYLYEGSAIPALRGKFVFADIVTGRVFYIDGDDLQAGKQQTVRELRLSFGGTEQELAAVASISNTYRAGPRVDLRLGIDALGELYLVTKADGWIRKLMPLE